MNIAPRTGIQGLRAQPRVMFMFSAVVLLLFCAAAIDPFLTAALGGIVSACLGWFFTQRIKHPLREVAEAARKIASGEHSARLPVPEKGGEIAVLATAINELLDSRERQNHELHTRETQFLCTFENAAVGIAHVGLDCRWHRVNSRLCEITGYPRSELLTKTFMDITHPDDLETDMANVRAMLAGEIPSYSMEKRYIRKDGSIVWVNLTVTLARDAAGQPAYLISVVEDISVRKQAEAALREREAQFRGTFENAAVGIAHNSLDGRWLRVNSKLCEITGYSHEELLARTFMEISHPAELDADLAYIRDMLEGKISSYSMEKRYIRKDGSIVWINLTVALERDATGQPAYFISVIEDISARKRAEEGMREREERLRMATAVGRIVTFEWDPITDVVIRSENFGKILGLDDEGSQSTGQEFFPLLHPEDRERLKGLLWGLNPAANTYATTYRVIRPGGGVLTFEERARGLFDEYGRLVRVIGMATEITDRKRAEDALRESEDRLSTVVEHLTEGLIIADSQGKLIRWNPAALTMLGYSSEEECRRNIPEFADTFEFKSPESGHALPIEEWPMPRVLRGEVLCDFEVRIHRFDQGWERLFSYSGSQVRSASGELLSVIVFTDITARKQAEEELSAAKEAAEAANRAKDDFLASLSHELRTPLNPVLMLASEMEHRDALSPDLREDFALIRKNVALEARLIDDLLDLTRITRGKLQLEMRQVNAHEVLNQALAVVHADMVQKRIALSVEPNASERLVKADPVRLQQIFWNVLCNAVKFTPSGGRITVRTHNTPERRICVEIADTGIGMTPEELEGMFTAFSQGEHAVRVGTQYRFGGLGLGLTICRQLATMHGGHIHAQSPGRGLGSTFTVELPLASAEAVSPEVPAGESPQAQPGAPKHFHILLVEDHEPTRITLSRLLRRRGHDVRCADSLAAGRKLVAELATPRGDAGFDLLISDLGLPDGSGYDLMTEVRKRYNGSVRGVALSGFGMEDDIQRSLASGFSTHLTKPVDIQSLETAMQMDEPSPRKSA